MPARRIKRFDAGVTVTNVEPSATSTIAVMAVTDSESTADNFFLCIAETSTFPNYALYYDAAGTFDVLDYDDVTTATFPGVFRLRSRVDANGESCEIDASPPPQMLMSEVLPVGNTYVGLRLREVVVSIQYVAVYSSP